MKIAFMAYSSWDKVMARLIYFRLVKERWQDLEIFMDEFSVRPSEDFSITCLEAARAASIGIIVLSDYTQRSAFVLQEIGILMDRAIPKIYVALHEDWKIPPGYDRTTRSFPMYDGNPYDNLERLVVDVKHLLLSRHLQYTNPTRKTHNLTVP